MEGVVERVDKLEEMVMRLVFVQQKTEMEIQDLKREMKEFKNEMREFKNEMLEFKNEVKREVKRINKQWVELANKMGTLVEDIIFPAARPVIEKYFKCEVKDLMMNVDRKRGDRREEFDVVAACEDKVFLIEVKATFRPEYVQKLKEKEGRFFDFFPEYKGKELVTIMGMVRFKPEEVKLLTESGIYAMGYREWEYMDILNFEDVKSAF